MKAKPGDTLLAGSGSTGLIVKVLGADGQPPYVVKWLPGGHIAMVDPDQYARVSESGQPTGATGGPGLVRPGRERSG
jgi:hypothetical protein